MKKISLFSFVLGLLVLMGCGDDDGDQTSPDATNAELMVTEATLTFTRQGGGAVVVARAQDPDGVGPLGLQVFGDITLQSASDYNLTIELRNNQNSGNAQDITQDIRRNAGQYMFFYSWTDGLFSDPVGNGNRDNRADAVNYNDSDANGNPIGFDTDWSTGPSSSGNFRVILKYQPGGLKTETSGTADGDTTIDISWSIAIR